jgi:spore coat polysaccharide biosynthesis protein SpsF (cytidylyltransferase family)/aryl-alcohol dehydrogenase-like predicted oxidoreductase
MLYSRIKHLKISRLGLGTAQFGMPYGFSRPKTQFEVDAILDACRCEGLTLIDTARMYGDSEQKIGNFLKTHPGHKMVVMTKLARVDEEDLSGGRRAYRVLSDSIAVSLKKLRIDRLPMLQSHQADSFVIRNDHFWHAVDRLRRRGYFELFGVAVYDPEPTRGLVREHQNHLDFVQAPYNLVDRRFEALFSLLKKKNIGLIGRSVFLKGMLTVNEALIPKRLSQLIYWRKFFKKAAQRLGLPLSELALLFSARQPCLQATLIGVDSLHELKTNLDAFGRHETSDGKKFRVSLKPVLDSHLTDPRRWEQIPNQGVAAILQARVSSRRLPGKILLPLQGKPMLFRQIERISRSRLIGRLIVATSTHPSDDRVNRLCKKYPIECMRGSLRDVLDRYYRVACKIRPRHVVRLTADCPLIDPELIDEIIAFYLNGNYDYVSNKIKPTYPNGLDVEVFSFAALERAWRQADLLSEREHVTPYIYKHPELFYIGNFRSRVDHSDMRWTVDIKGDYLFVKTIYDALYCKKSDFNTADIMNYLKRHPKVSALNHFYPRDLGYQLSLNHDRRIKNKPKKTVNG